MEKYKAFVALERLTREAEEQVLRLSYAQGYKEVQLQLANTSRIPAEDLTVRLDFTGDISIGLFELDDEERPETDSSARYSTVVGLVPPQDAVALPAFVIRINKGLKQVDFSARITGRNLPEIQSIPLTIQIGEQAEQDAPAEEAPAAT